MPDIQQIIEALDCFTTKQHKCDGCPFNPHPGREWPYGCVRGQNEIVAAAQEALRSMNNDLISRSALLDAYDAAHKGPPGGARKLIAEAPAVYDVPVCGAKMDGGDTG